MKKIVCLALTAALALGNSSAVLAKGVSKAPSKATHKVQVQRKASNPKIAIKQAVKVTSKSVKYKNKNIEVDMKIPVVSGLKDKKVEASINSKIYNEVMNFKKEVEKDAKVAEKEYKKSGLPMRAYAAYSKYSVHYNAGNLLSVTLDEYSYEGGAHGMTNKVSYNIDLKTGKEASLKDFFNGKEKYKEIISKEIKRQMLVNKNSFFKEAIDGFQGITWGQSFYIENGNVVVYYGLYEIAPYASGIPQFKIPFKLFKSGVKTNISVKENPIKVTTKAINNSNDKITEDISIPVFSGMSNNKIQDKLNKDLESKTIALKVENEKEANKYYDEYIKAGGKKEDYPGYQLSVNYKVLGVDKGILSFYVENYEYTGGAHGSTSREYRNVDLKTGKEVTIKDLFKKGADYKKAINAEIKKQISKNPDIYFKGNDGFKGISEKQGFYIEDGNIVVGFGKYEIAPGATGTPEFTIQSSLLAKIIK